MQTQYTSQGLFPWDSWVPALRGFELRGKPRAWEGKALCPGVHGSEVVSLLPPSHTF